MRFLLLVILICIISSCLGCIHDIVSDRSEIKTSPQQLEITSKKRTQPVDADFNRYLRIHWDYSLLQPASDTNRSCYSANNTAVLIGDGNYDEIDTASCSTKYAGNTTLPNNANCTYQCLATDLATQLKAIAIQDVIDDASVIINKALKVIPIGGNLILSSGKCGFWSGVQVPNSFTTTGVNAEVAIFVTMRPIPKSQSVMATGVACQTDQNSRPIAGQLNFNPIAVQQYTAGTALYRRQVYTVVHEVFHILGFSDSLYGTWRNPTNYSQAWGRSNIISESSISVTPFIGYYKAVTPKVIAKAKSYFNCGTLNGVELENGGGIGQTKSHFEKRIFGNEIMVASSTDYPNYYPQLSEMTLAFLEDSGWYRANYTAVDTSYTYLKGVACSEIQPAKCPTSTKSQYCYEGGKQGCTFDGRFTGVCDFSTTLMIPEYYQHYVDPAEGGPDELNDHCPQLTPYITGDCLEKTQEGDTVDKYGESRGSNSRCYISSLTSVASGLPPRANAAACHTTACLTTNTLSTKIGNGWYDCSSNATLLDATGFNGKLYCPTATAIALRCNVPGTVYYDKTTWPIIADVSPSTGARGTIITITGTGFTANSKVSAIGTGFDHDFENVEVLSSVTITATVPNVTLSAVVDTTVVYISVELGNDPLSRSVTYQDGFTILHKVDNQTWQQKAYQWMFVDNLIFTICALVALFLIIVVIVVVVIKKCNN